jgi:hypothetical protein
MKVFEAHIKSTTPYSQSKHHQTPKLEKESSADYEERTWRQRMHINEDGYVVIPPMSFKNCLSDAAKFLSMQIPSKGKSTYTKHFEAGVLVVDETVLDIKREDVEPEWLFVPSDGRRGGTTRVAKCFGKIHKWEATVKFIILDETITLSVFKKHLTEAGNLIGIGRFRPRNNGFYGRFKVVSVKEDEME